MPQRLITLVTSALLIGGLFVGAPGPVLAVADSMNVYIGFNSSTSGGSCADPDYTVDGSDDSTAIDGAANDTAAGGTLHFCPGTYDVNATIVLTGKDITLSGASAATTILDGGALYDGDGIYMGQGVRILQSSVSDITISGLTLQRGHTAAEDDDGGAIKIDSGDITVSDSNFVNNYGGNGDDAYGGAVWVYGTATITGSTFTENRSRFGGAIWSDDDTTVTDSTFTSNTATEDGGAIISYGDLTVTRSTFTGNTATEDGGAIYADDYYGDVINVTVTSSTFTNNSADSDGGDGGAINADTVIATSSTFTGNSADYGGAISGYDTATVTNSTFMENSAESSGGAVITYNGIITRSRFTRNTAGEHGGAVTLWDQNSADLRRLRGNTFMRNTAPAGGAIALRSCETTYTRSEVRRVERVNRLSGNRATQQRRTNNIELWVDDCR